jgi:hypothetical protein
VRPGGWIHGSPDWKRIRIRIHRDLSRICSVCCNCRTPLFIISMTCKISIFLPQFDRRVDKGRCSGWTSQGQECLLNQDGLYYCWEDPPVHEWTHASVKFGSIDSHSPMRGHMGHPEASQGDLENQPIL